MKTRNCSFCTRDSRSWLGCVQRHEHVQPGDILGDIFLICVYIRVCVFAYAPVLRGIPVEFTLIPLCLESSKVTQAKLP